MSDLKIEIAEEELPAPGEIVKIEREGYVLLVENANPPGDAEDADENQPYPGDVVKYVPVETAAPTAQVRHAAVVYQRNRALALRGGRSVIGRRCVR